MNDNKLEKTTRRGGERWSPAFGSGAQSRAGLVDVCFIFITAGWKFISYPLPQANAGDVAVAIE
jgi:hypothetical protein